MASASVLVYGLGLFALFRVLQRSPKAFANDLTKKARLIWYTLFAPNGAEDHNQRIDNFYRGQADLYDDSRKRLLRGRKTMLRLSAAHLQASNVNEASGRERLIWVDIGGGTGYNIEAMNEFMPIHKFDAIYLVDICEPLLKIARRRIRAKGWKNVHVIRQDAATFELPEYGWSKLDGVKGSLRLVTFSYSLSMIPNFWPVLDRISTLLTPSIGIISVVDFYTSGRTSETTSEIAGVGRKCNWLSRWFWQIWFDLDGVHLGSQRREYLEHRFKTVKCYNGRNRFFPVLVRIPYYIWLGTVESEGKIGMDQSIKSTQDQLKIGRGIDHEERWARSGTRWRVPYSVKPVHKSMKTFMYSFTWEDPFEDLEYLEAGPEDSILAITSAGDNVLHYVSEVKPRVMHCVDMNPCQGHLFELKLAALSVLPYEDFFSLFGLGRFPDFHQTLDLKLSPFLSSACYQFWKQNAHIFKSPSSLYLHGYSGVALRLLRNLFKVTGREGDVMRFCNARSIAEQEKVWRERIRPVVLNPLTVFVLDNPLFCWKALGVPRNQRKMLLEEGSAYKYVEDTFDPVVKHKLLREGAYHYLLPLLGHYTPASCPLYLSKASFAGMRSDKGKALDSVRIHTDYISNVLRDLEESSLTRAIVMDHLDWFEEGSVDAKEEIQLLFRTLKPGGFVLFRSAARAPWYAKAFKEGGFDVTRLKCRQPGSKVALDGVNMYASLWKALRPST